VTTGTKYMKYEQWNVLISISQISAYRELLTCWKGYMILHDGGST